MRLLRNKRGQSTLEYAILIVVVIVALIGVQGYITRAVQGRARDAADGIGRPFDAGSAEYNYTTTTHAEINEERDAWTTTTRYPTHWENREGWETIGNYEALSWGSGQEE